MYFNVSMIRNSIFIHLIYKATCLSVCVLCTAAFEDKILQGDRGGPSDGQGNHTHEPPGGQNSKKAVADVATGIIFMSS